MNRYRDTVNEELYDLFHFFPPLRHRNPLQKAQQGRSIAFQHVEVENLFRKLKSNECDVVFRREGSRDATRQRENIFSVKVGWQNSAFDSNTFYCTPFAPTHGEATAFEALFIRFYDPNFKQFQPFPLNPSTLRPRYISGKLLNSSSFFSLHKMFANYDLVLFFLLPNICG